MKAFVILSIITILVYVSLTSSLSINHHIIKRQSRAEIRKQNADDAEALTAKFSTFTPDTACTPNDTACINGAFAKCATVADGTGTVNKYQITSCNTGLTCVVLPLVNKPGTSIVCSTEEDRKTRLDQARKDL